MELQSKDTSLLFKITHGNPIEMKDFVSTMNSLENLFETFVKDKADSSSGRKAKLYVEKIEHGCIEVYLTEAIIASALPFIENFNSIVEFAGFLKNVIQGIIGGCKDTKLSISELKSLHDLFAVSANDPRGSVSFMAFDKGNPAITFNNCTFNFSESNAIQNQTKKAIELARSEKSTDLIHIRKVLTIHQMRRDLGTDAGNRGVIEDLSDKPLPIIFETDELKNRILYSSENPTLQAYFVDVVVQTSGGKPIAYKIVALHDVIPLD